MLRTIETAALVWSRAIGPWLLRGTFALIFLWFGAPKLFPGGSPAEEIATLTVERITMGLLSGDNARVFVGILEILLALAILVPRWTILASGAIVGHLTLTFLPLALFPEQTWHAFGVGTLEGQYIIKNLVLMSGLVCLIALGTRGHKPVALHGPESADRTNSRTPRPLKAGPAIVVNDNVESERIPSYA